MFEPNGLVVLTTDFGTGGSYVGAMRGAVLSACPSARLVDLTHDIPPQDVREAARVLEAAVPYYPAGTVHLVVVDPGVGTDRRPVVVLAGGQAFVGPDNGVLVSVAQRLGLTGAWSIDAPDLHRAEVSATFHGRDIFGPTAGALAAGHHAETVGAPVTLVPGPGRPEVTVSGGRVVGVVEAVDHFGNILTTIPRHLVPQGPVQVTIAGRIVTRFVRSYGEAVGADVVALYSSEGRLEVARPNGNAARALGVTRGAQVSVESLPASDGSEG